MGQDKKWRKSTDSQTKGLLMCLLLVGMVTGQQIVAQKMILEASSSFCGRINIHIQWFLSEANIYQEDLDTFLVIAVLNFNGLNSTLCRSALLANFSGAGWGARPQVILNNHYSHRSLTTKSGSPTHSPKSGGDPVYIHQEHPRLQTDASPFFPPPPLLPPSVSGVR